MHGSTELFVEALFQGVCQRMSLTGTRSEGIVMAEERYVIERHDIKPGWSYFVPGDPAPPPHRVAEFLNVDVMHWLKENSKIRVRATLPFVANGNTVAIHVSFD